MSSHVAVVGNADPDNGLNVNEMNADNGNDNVHAVRLIVSGRKILFKGCFAWRILSILQAFCLFPASIPEVLNNFYH